MYDAFKRIVDLTICSIAIIFIGIILSPLIIALRLTGEGEIFYRQKRVGHRNKDFYMIKFATMVKNSLKMGTGVVTLKNDSRFTPLGKFLRKTKLNELPQLINVALGDMSLVGARPLLRKQSFAYYPEEVQNIIYNSKPGITGLGSLVMRDEEDILASIHESGKDPHHFYKYTLYPFKGKLETHYQANRGFWFDLKILLVTFLAIPMPNVNWVKRFFNDLPERPKELMHFTA